MPVSATGVRADVVAGWAALGPGARAMLTARVVVVGAESTGTTTVSRLLAERLQARGGAWASTRWVPEAGREVTAQKQEAVFAATGRRPIAVDWDGADFERVVAMQNAWEESAARAGGPVLVCDTDAFVTPVWERRYLGERAAALDPAALGRGDVYLVTDHAGVPFVQDGLRDGEHIRQAMTADITAALITHGRPWALLTGTLAERVDLAQRIADQAAARKLAMVPPI